jgi:hypothetical protein
LNGLMTAVICFMAGTPKYSQRKMGRCCIALQLFKHV